MDPDRSRQFSSDPSSPFVVRRLGTYEIHAPPGAGAPPALAREARARELRRGLAVAKAVYP